MSEQEKSEKIKEHNDNLTRLGKEISKIQFNYKIIENTTSEYWQKRIDEFKRHNEKAIEYHTHAYALMNLIDTEQSGLFLLRISKLQQIGMKLIAVMEQVKQNPTSVKSKDKQQSKWSIELREKLVESNSACLDHETGMSKFFREFYESHLKNVRQD